jgi:hypothetical protein
MNSNSIEQNWDAIWYRIIENFVATMVLEKKKDSLKKHKSVKTPFHLSLLGNWLNKFLFGTIQRKIYSTGWLTNFKVVYSKLVSMNYCHWIFLKMLHNLCMYMQHFINIKFDIPCALLRTSKKQLWRVYDLQT